MTAGAALRIWFVVGDALMAAHTARSVCFDACQVHFVAGSALRVARALRVAFDSVKPGKLLELVTAGARGLCGNGAAVRLVTRGAIAVPLGALLVQLFVTAPACRQSRQGMDTSLVTGLAAFMVFVAY